MPVSSALWMRRSKVMRSSCIGIPRSHD
jgi:hypothetical protein